MRSFILALTFALSTTLPSAFVPGHGVSVNVSTGAPTFTYSWTEGQLAADDATLNMSVFYTDGTGTPFTSEYSLNDCQPSGDGDGEIPQNFAAGDFILLDSTWYDTDGSIVGTASTSVFL